MGRTISIYHPSDGFPSVSVTGHACSRSCAHCDGRYLKGMVDVTGEDSLYRFGVELERKGSEGMLVSGGCDPFGRVPVGRPFLDQIRKLKDETDLRINMHAGLVESDDAVRISESGVDVVSFDLIGDDRTIHEVLHLDRTVEDYIGSYEYLVDAGLRVVPHILAGFHFGELKGEFRAVDIASVFDPERAVLISLIPTPGTSMENIDPPADDDILSVGRYMVSKLNGELILGCMRPKGNPGLESSILELGFDGVVLPAKKTLTYIGSKNWKTRELCLCCAADFPV